MRQRPQGGRVPGQHPAVTWVNYAGLPGHPDYQRAQRYFPLGPGAVFGFGIKGGQAAGEKFIAHVKLCLHLANILDARTLVIHPASTTHGQLGEAEMAAAGVTPDMIRLSVGLEEAEDIPPTWKRAGRLPGGLRRGPRGDCLGSRRGEVGKREPTRQGRRGDGGTRGRGRAGPP